MLNSDAWTQLREQCEQCRLCELHEHRTQLVFGAGDVGARLMLIGEAPGEKEDLSGTPFIGRSGRQLDALLEEAGLDRSTVYIANTVKCRPPANRDPSPAELNACGVWLSRQIELLAPRVIVCLGKFAARRMIDPKFMISQQHGQWFTTSDGRDITAIYHPAALLRNPGRRPDTLADLKSVRARLLQPAP
ncbi:MAG: uracil-DNA glycosylase [Oscillospiraceae bacterium]|jgi:DNA polymerase|nr:uracil-DNA glycosylase [Oscillospiraceae bacterium]